MLELCYITSSFYQYMSQLLRILDWEKKLSSSSGTPPHLGFNRKDARAFLTILYGTSAIDLHWDEDANHKLQERGVSVHEKLVCSSNLPERVIYEFNQLEDEIQVRVRANLRRVLIPTNAQGKLDVMLPIEVLEQLIEKAGFDWLYSEKGRGWIFWSEKDFQEGCSDQAGINRSIPYLSDWLVCNNDLNRRLVIWDRYRITAAIIYTDSCRKVYRQHLGANRRNLVHTFNNRRTDQKYS